MKDEVLSWMDREYREGQRQYDLIGAQVVVGNSPDAFDDSHQQCGAAITSSSAGQIHEFQCKNEGRYIFIRLAGTGKILSLTEMTVYVDGVLFDGGTATQSSVEAGTFEDKIFGQANYARDGQDNTFTKTTWDEETETGPPNPWWRLDLGGCSCGTTTCTRTTGLYCVASSNTCTTRPATVCEVVNGLTTNAANIDCKCGSNDCQEMSGNVFCMASSNSCSSTCIVGTQLNENTLVVDCEACPAGYYGGGGNTRCTACATGYYNANQGSTSIQACTACAKGTYGDHIAAVAADDNLIVGSFTCLPCDSGKWSNTAALNDPAACTNCIIGKYSFHSGSKSIDSCLDCIGKIIFDTFIHLHDTHLLFFKILFLQKSVAGPTL